MPNPPYPHSPNADAVELFCSLAVAWLSLALFLVSTPRLPEVQVVIANSVHEIAQATVAIPVRAPVAHLKIPQINVDAVIRDMGVTSEGAMAVPANRVDVGWYSLGTRPGQTGSAVIGGHNRWDSAAAVFEHLDQLRQGDVLLVVDAKGVSTSFVVRDMRTFDATDANSGIFESTGGSHLNLITCSGAWDPATRSYTKRLVVFTDAV